MCQFLLRISLRYLRVEMAKAAEPENCFFAFDTSLSLQFLCSDGTSVGSPSDYRVSSSCNYPTRKCHECEGITTPILPAHEIPSLRAPALFCLKTKTVLCKLLFWWFGSFSNFFSTIFPKFLKFAHLLSNRSPFFRCDRGGAGNRVPTSRNYSHMFAHAWSQPKLTSRKLRLFRPA